MKRLILALALSLTALVGTSSAQGVSGIWPDPAWCPTCYVASHSDSPSAGSTITGSEVIWAWAGLCYDGTIPTHVAATAVVNGEAWSVQADYNVGGPRADVTAHLQANGCHGGHAVVAVWFPNGLPSGTERVSVRFHYQQIFAYQVYEVSSEIPLTDGPQQYTHAASMTSIRLEQTKANTVTITLTDEQKAALDWYIAATPEQRREGRPFVDNTPAPPTVESLVMQHLVLSGIIEQHKRFLEKSAAATGKLPGVGALRKATPAKCAEVAKVLGVTVKELPCGGGQ